MRKKIASWILFILGGIAIFLGLSALLTLSAADRNLIAIAMISGLFLLGGSFILSALYILKCQKFWKKSILTILVSFMISLIFLVYALMVTPSDITDIPQSVGIKWELNRNDIDKEESNLGKMKWYSSLSEALQDTSSIHSKEGYSYYKKRGSLLDKQILSAENTTKINLYYSINDNHYALVRLYQRNKSYSKPYDFTLISCKNCRLHWPYRYDLDDSVAESIIDSIVDNNINLKDSQNIIISGVWDNKKELKSLRIDGKALDKIKPVRKGSRYYYWFFHSDSFAAKLKKINFTKFTYEEMIKTLSISYTKDQ